MMEKLIKNEISVSKYIRECINSLTNPDCKIKVNFEKN